MKQLKYLFKVLYTDGSEYHQNAEDKPVGGTGSCFTDVLNSGKEIHIFEMYDPDGTDYFSIDLLTGQFCVNGVFFVGEVKTQLPIALKRELIFFRQVQQDVKVELKDGQITNREALGSRTTYCIGWKAKYLKKSYQYIIKVT